MTKLYLIVAAVLFLLLGYWIVCHSYLIVRLTTVALAMALLFIFLFVVVPIWGKMRGK